MPPVLALFGAAALVGLAIKFVGDSIEAKEKEDAFRAANGWSLAEVAGELTAGFDADGDGRLAFDAVQGVRFLGESTRTSRSTRTSLYTGYGVAPGTKLLHEDIVRYSIEPMLRKADSDHDGVVTAAELQTVLRTYDADGNGRVTKAERARMHAELGEVRIDSSSRIVGVLQPPAPVATTSRR